MSLVDMLMSTACTLLRLSLSIAIGFIAAFPIGLLLGLNRGCDRIFAPLIMMLYAIPKISLFPLAILLFGLNDTSRIIVVSSVIFFQVLITIRDAARRLPPAYKTSIDTLGAERINRLRFLYIPFLLPAVFTSLRISTGAAFAVLFFTETSAVREAGLGRLVISKWSEINYPAMYLAAGITAAIGFLLFILIDICEKQLVRGR